MLSWRWYRISWQWPRPTSTVLCIASSCRARWILSLSATTRYEPSYRLVSSCKLWSITSLCVAHQHQCCVLVTRKEGWYHDHHSCILSLSFIATLLPCECFMVLWWCRNLIQCGTRWRLSIRVPWNCPMGTLSSSSSCSRPYLVTILVFNHKACWFLYFKNISSHFVVHFRIGLFNKAHMWWFQRERGR